VNHRGTHVIADIHTIEFPESDKLKILCADALKISNMSVLSTQIHDFSDTAFTGLFLLAESHFSIHTFPECGYISLDCYTCGDGGKPLLAISHIVERLKVRETSIKIIERA
jgi:S-adenosylmethionine decarboxylase